MLNSKQLQPLIRGPLNEDNIQQIGIDLNLIKVERLNTIDVRMYEDNEDSSITFLPWENAGFIPYNGKTILCARTEVPLETVIAPDNQQIPTDKIKVWRLNPGVYDITFAQGVAVPANLAMFIRQRSSMLRNGALLHSSVFDPGFETDNIGTILHVRENIVIEYNARIAQIYAHVCEPVSEDKLYSGQWQGDKQRSEQA